MKKELHDYLEEKRKETRKPFLCRLGLHQKIIPSVFDLDENDKFKKLYVIQLCVKCFKWERIGLAHEEKK